MFKVESEKVVKYYLKVPEDIVKFCQWALFKEQDEILTDAYNIVDFLDVIANKVPNYTAPNGEINIEYE